ncbi:MAG: FmdB family zinc ribbon protein [bacterium JZ-2024 1]
MMPIFEYRCRSCGAVVEEVIFPGDPEPANCTACGGVLARKVPSSVGITFKGSGFFVTDNRKQGGADYSEGSTPGKGSSSPAPQLPASKSESFHD